MYEIVKNETIVPNIVYMSFRAPKIASTARPGQFVIIRADERGERIPMGLAGWDEKEGTVDILFYVLGTSTAKLSTLKLRQGHLRLRLLWGGAYPASDQGAQGEGQLCGDGCGRPGSGFYLLEGQAPGVQR
ncbi:MAG: hypothetical protein LUQ08_06390 [Methanothrix sp.]|nr:hypothetical protein [Methanothrix sp.]